MEKRLITSLVGAAMLMAASPALAERNLALSVHSSTVAATGHAECRCYRYGRTF